MAAAKDEQLRISAPVALGHIAWKRTGYARFYGLEGKPCFT
jgi:hypothetical protein